MEGKATYLFTKFIQGKNFLLFLIYPSIDLLKILTCNQKRIINVTWKGVSNRTSVQTLKFFVSTISLFP